MKRVLISPYLSLGAAVAVALARQTVDTTVVARPNAYDDGPDIDVRLDRQRDQTAPRSPKQRFRKSSKR